MGSRRLLRRSFSFPLGPKRLLRLFLLLLLLLRFLLKCPKRLFIPDCGDL